ncbi:transposase, partial [Escherichia coli]|uniref:transposase n=1 Tax=Escherichia coli TaxID=562 RepID=UPI003964834A
QDWRKEPRKNYSNEFKLRMVELASQPGACVAQIARENGVNDNEPPRFSWRVFYL